MHHQKIILVVINVVGGIAVLGSYAAGIMSHPETRGTLWGNVPRSMIPLYTVMMFAAAVGYLACLWFILFKLNPNEVSIFGRFSYPVFYWLYALILVPSAFWMPLTFLMIENPQILTWIGIRAVLGLTAVGAVLLTVAVGAAQPVDSVWAHRAAVAGGVLFSVHTTILDAIVWTAYFPHG